MCRDLLKAAEEIEIGIENIEGPVDNDLQGRGFVARKRGGRGRRGGKRLNGF